MKTNGVVVSFMVPLNRTDIDGRKIDREAYCNALREAEGMPITSSNGDLCHGIVTEVNILEEAAEIIGFMFSIDMIATPSGVTITDDCVTVNKISAMSLSADWESVN